MILYLTYGEPPSGVYSSQVTDVIRFLKKRSGADIRLIAFISLHDFRKSKAHIRSELPDAIVVPMLPKATYWRFNTLLLWLICLWYRPASLIARNVIAANMALTVKGKSAVAKVCFDGRGAIAAEWKEYDVKVVPSWKKEIDSLERLAVLQSDFRIAVSAKLVDYWRRVYNYTGNTHVIIPCTLNSHFRERLADRQEIQQTRASLGLENEDVVLVYSGSVSGWQSFQALAACLRPFLRESTRHKTLFLSAKEKHIDALSNEFPGQILQKWVKHTEVTSVISACDMGILIRENSVTNEVASPTKFAEYLSAGLPVLISENLGDYTDFVRKYDCGLVVHGQMLIKARQPDMAERERMAELVRNNFTKDAQQANYLRLIQSMS